MKIRNTARQSEIQDQEYTLWDNTVAITGLPKGIDLDEVIELADDNGGQVLKDKPLAFIFYECGQRWISVEIDTFEGHLEELVVRYNETLLDGEPVMTVDEMTEIMDS